MLADIGRHAEQAVDDDAVFRRQIIEVDVRQQRVDTILRHDALRNLLHAAARTPGVVDAGRTDNADIDVAHEEVGRAAELAGEIDRNIVVALNERGVGIGQARGQVTHLRGGEIGAGGDGIARGKGVTQVARQRARAIVEPGEVGRRTEIGIADLAGGDRVAAGAELDLEERVARYRLGGEVDRAAAEFAGIVDRIALLDGGRGDDAGREDVERHRAAQRIGRGQRRSVHQRERIALAQAADEHEAATDDAETGHALQRPGNIAIGGARDIGFAQHRHHFGRRFDHIGDEDTAHHDFAVAAGTRTRNLDIVFGRHVFGRGIGSGGGGSIGLGRGRLLGKGRRRNQRRADHQQCSERKRRELRHMSLQKFKKGAAALVRRRPGTGQRSAIRWSECSAQRCKPASSCRGRRSSPGSGCRPHRAPRRYRSRRCRSC